MSAVTHPVAGADPTKGIPKRRAVSIGSSTCRAPTDISSSLASFVNVFYFRKQHSSLQFYPRFLQTVSSLSNLTTSNIIIKVRKKSLWKPVLLKCAGLNLLSFIRLYGVIPDILKSDILLPNLGLDKF
ncbi:hypothetical protein HUJ04_012646 [Dendroctonus ponderosae]|nr:hypothetical protein HUJ04_012646 [Dendroctonus ponderosae]KAH1029886.1 hypothetical protein HUJ05_003038 [Dendroctonus ponderosae]